MCSPKSHTSNHSPDVGVGEAGLQVAGEQHVLEGRVVGEEGEREDARGCTAPVRASSMEKLRGW